MRLRFVGEGPGSPGHPKTRLHQIVGDSPRSEAPISNLKRTIAERARLDVLEQRCPGGFRPFATDVRHKLARDR